MREKVFHSSHRIMQGRVLQRNHEVTQPLDISKIEFKNILLIRFARLGDVILLVPSIRALRSRYPQARIEVLVDYRYAPIVEMCSAIDRVIPVNRLEMRNGGKIRAVGKMFSLAHELRAAAYDLVLDFHSFRETHLLTWYTRARWRLGLKRVHSSYWPFCFNLGPVLEDDALHVSDVFLSILGLLGISPVSNGHLLDLNSELRQEADSFLNRHPVEVGALRIGFNLGAGSQSRIWPPERFAELADRIIQRHKAVVIAFSGPNEEWLSSEFCRRVRSTGVIPAPNLALPQLAALFNRCHVLVSNDTGPMHLGAAAGVPTLGLFSVARPNHYHPLGASSRYVKCDSMEQLDLEIVYQNFLQILASLPTQHPLL
ncbi:MAG: glycosyltransferase family 9 protein [Acidobacteria bacterium]|nr:glycosyltransferase family 9 protein [Acidobacteriota bacterium]